MPIQYGTVQCGSILGGLLFYREFEYMAWWQYALTLAGLLTIVGGIVFGSVGLPHEEAPHKQDDNEEGEMPNPVNCG